MLWAPWRLKGPALEEGKRDAVLLALREQEQAGIDIVTDGEQTRRHFVWGFVERLEGIDFSRMVTIGIRADRYQATCLPSAARCADAAPSTARTSGGRAPIPRSASSWPCPDR